MRAKDLHPSYAPEIDEAVLYRGDSTPVALFDFDKTDKHALFGRGIYLTDNTAVAGDYTIKSSSDVVFRPKNEVYTEKDLVHDYLLHIVINKLDWGGRVSNIKERWLEKRRTEKLTQDEMYAGYKTELKAESKKQMAAAKKLYRSERPSMRLVKLTTGECMFVKPERAGEVSTFDIPNEYLERTIDGDAPLSDEVLNIIRELFVNRFGADRKLDMRNRRGEFLTFDTWVETYKTEGVKYAWENEIVGGDHQNPSLDVIRNGTHFGLSFFSDDQSERDIIKALMAVGIVGIRYDGGVKTGSNLRGGGGHQHTAYCLWDAKAVADFRKESRKMIDNEPTIGAEKGIRASALVY